MYATKWNASPEVLDCGPGAALAALARVHVYVATVWCAALTYRFMHEWLWACKAVVRGADDVRRAQGVSTQICWQRSRKLLELLQLPTHADASVEQHV